MRGIVGTSVHEALLTPLPRVTVPFNSESRGKRANTGRKRGELGAQRGKTGGGTRGPNTAKRGGGGGGGSGGWVGLSAAPGSGCADHHSSCALRGASRGPSPWAAASQSCLCAPFPWRPPQAHLPRHPHGRWRPEPGCSPAAPGPCAQAGLPISWSSSRPVRKSSDGSRMASSAMAAKARTTLFT